MFYICTQTHSNSQIHKKVSKSTVVVVVLSRCETKSSSPRYTSKKHNNTYKGWLIYFKLKKKKKVCKCNVYTTDAVSLAQKIYLFVDGKIPKTQSYNSNNSWRKFTGKYCF